VPISLWNPISVDSGRRPEAFPPIEIGLSGRFRAGRRPSPTQKTPSRSAQADRWPKAFEAEFIRRTGRPMAEGFPAD
jgi:hypothetical protein